MNQPTETLLNELDERERVLTLLNLLPEVRSYTIRCAHTGVAVATMDLIMQAGKVPYLSNWKDSVAYHPLFALNQHQLLAWVRKNWNFLFRETTDRATPVQKEQFCIAFVAVLHTLGSIKQEVPILPSFDTVNKNMQRLLELAYWHHYLDSQRFHFPTLRINRLNANSSLGDIGAYFDICESVKYDWETSKDAKAEEAKLEAAQKAEKAVRAGHIKGVSKKMLWNWFLSSVNSFSSKKFQLPEWQEWKLESTKLWLGSDNQQLQYSLDDVNAIEDVYLQTCTIGTSVSHAFRTELNKVREHISNHTKLWEIDWTETIKSPVKRVDAAGNEIGTNSIENTPPKDPGEAPKSWLFQKRFDFLKAEAKWKVEKLQYDAWIEKYGKKGEGE